MFPATPNEPERVLPVPFDVAVQVTEPLPVPLEDDIVIQLVELLTDHVQVGADADTLIVPLPPQPEAAALVGEIENVQLVGAL